jgi:uncharacterized membrane protein YfcA
MPIIFAGLVSGIVSGLGMGGGTLLVLFLTLSQNIDQHISQAANLIFFIPTSIVAIIVHLKNKNISKKHSLKIIPLGIIGAIIGAYIATLVESNKLRKYFGIFLICIGIYSLIMKIIKYKKNKKDNNINI